MKQIGAVLVLLLCFTFIGAEEMDFGFKSEYIITSSESPWKGFTGSAEEEQAGKILPAVPMDYSLLVFPKGTASYTWNAGEPLLAIDREKRKVVINKNIFSELHRADATRAEPNEKQIIGIVNDAKLKKKPSYLFSFLIDSQIIETYWHIEATIRYQDSFEKDNIFSAYFHGTHKYYTNKKNEVDFDFSIHLDINTGEIWITG